MTTFTRSWDETDPADANDAKEGAKEIREFKTDIRERIAVDHYFTPDAYDGYHKKASLIEQASNPSTEANVGFVYTKDVGGITELFYKDSAGNVLQITNAGGLQPLPAGVIQAYAGASTPSGWLLCYGQSVLRADYPALFTAIGTTYGAVDGSHFTLPDLRGRAVFGKDDMGGSAASRITSAGSGIAANNLGGTGGDQLLQNHGHTASVTDPGHVHGTERMTGAGYGQPAGAIPYPGAATTDSAVTGISVGISSAGSGGSQNMPPAIILHYIIKT